MTLKLPTPLRGISKLFSYVTALLSCTIGHTFLIPSKWNASVGPAAIFGRLLSNNCPHYWCSCISTGASATWDTLLVCSDLPNVTVHDWRSANGYEVPVSNFAPKTGYSDWYFRVLTQSRHTKAAIITQMKPWILPSIWGAIQYSLLVLPLTVCILHN
jgi:hypothetical protein